MGKFSYIPFMKPIVVIGAGVAGLAAAHHLAKAGREIILLEARNRVGGRIHTVRNTDVPIELGAEFVHGKPPAVWELAQAAHLKLQEVTERHWYFENGELSKSRDFWKNVEGLMERMKSSEIDMPFQKFLDSLPHDEATARARDMARRYVEGFHAADTNRAGIKGLVKANEGADSIEGARAFRFENGYGSLVEVLQAQAEMSGARLHLSTVVKEIRWHAATIEVITESASAQQTFQGSAVLVTIPLALLQHHDTGSIKFVPELPDRKTAAIQNLLTGNVLRLTLEFRERFWERVKLWNNDGVVVSFRDAGFFHYRDAPIPTWWTQMPLRAPILVGWAGGPRADRIIRTDELRQQAITSLAAIFNLPAAEINDQLQRLHFHNWRNDPFSRGAYTYLPVNGLASQLALAEPIENKLFFAGEATAVGHVGTVHGALQTGERAANEILFV